MLLVQVGSSFPHFAVFHYTNGNNVSSIEAIVGEVPGADLKSVFKRGRYCLWYYNNVLYTVAVVTLSLLSLKNQ